MPSRFLKHRRLIAEATGALIAALGLALAFQVRFEFQLAPVYVAMLGRSLPWAVTAKLIAFRAFGLRHLGWRHIGFEDLLRIAAAHASGAMVSAIILRTLIGSLLPRSVYVLDFLLCLVLEVALRSGIRLFMETGRLESRLAADRTRSQLKPRRTLIYGAGAAGVRVLSELRAHPELGYQVEGFLDDDVTKHSMRLRGLQVLGGCEKLAELANRHRIDDILIALADATGPKLTAILEQCHLAGVAAKRIPGLSEQIDDKALAHQIREVRLEDLLGRLPIHLDDDRVRHRIRGQVILVTGAGGSIGSELCRQIARFHPAALIGLDQAETPLYEIEQELSSTFPELNFIPEIASVRSRRNLHDVFSRHRPGAVYHAAAYKHVPMMEAHMFEAVTTNIFGTRNVARAAAAWGVSDLVLISSDKAVRPTNVMGATKRVAELVALVEGSVADGRDTSVTNTVAVRFGNVLGSNGSVVPRFRQQIAKGGPVTVTHPEIRRFFMTIPEAAQLVLQAGTMGVGGEVFVLDMGEPVRIQDLARNMILLSGLRPGTDIPITFSGLRPGEKMYEELSAYEENTAPTPHQQIRVFNGPRVPIFELQANLSKLRTAVRQRDIGAAVLSLKVLVPDYSPSSELLGRALLPPVRSLRARRAKADRSQKGQSTRAFGARA